MIQPKSILLLPIYRALNNLSPRLIKNARDEMRKPKHGKVYIIKGKKHIASAEGEAPANLSGKLSKSIHTEQKNGILSFGADQKYATFLELGTRKMAERPNYKRTIDKNINFFKRELDKQIDLQLRSLF